MSLLELELCSLNNAGIVAIASSINKIDQLIINNHGKISKETCKELAKNIRERNSPVS